MFIKQCSLQKILTKLNANNIKIFNVGRVRLYYFHIIECYAAVKNNENYFLIKKYI